MTYQVDFIRIKNFIDGEWVEEAGVEYVPLYNPSNGEQIGEVPLSKPETSILAVRSAHAAYDAWRNTTVNNRVSYLYKIRQAMIDKEEALAFARWLGEGFDLPTVKEWRAIYTALRRTSIPIRDDLTTGMADGPATSRNPTSVKVQPASNARSAAPATQWRGFCPS